MYSSKKVTIKDVANRAGVAVSTVSRVLNNQNRVSPETREKVQEAIEELSFTQNQLAVGVVTGATKIILIIVPDFCNSFYGSVIDGAEKYLKEHGYLTLVSSSSDDPNADISDILSRTSALVDGAIIIPTGYESEKLSLFKKTIVFVDRSVSGSNGDSVFVDNLGGTYLLTRELLLAGHRKIAIISGRTSLSVGAARLDGYKRAFSDYMLPINDSYIKTGNFIAADGYDYFQKLMHMDDPPTAVLAGNNLICTGCICAAKDLGLRIGKDISLVGFDDTELASLQEPGITVISRPTTEMGTVAAKLLIERLNNTAPVVQREVILPVTLIRRNSVFSMY